MNHPLPHLRIRGTHHGEFFFGWEGGNVGKVWEAGAQDGIPEQLSPLLSCQSLSPDPENKAPG